MNWTQFANNIEVNIEYSRNHQRRLFGQTLARVESTHNMHSSNIYSKSAKVLYVLYIVLKNSDDGYCYNVCFPMWQKKTNLCCAREQKKVLSRPVNIGVSVLFQLYKSTILCANVFCACNFNSNVYFKLLKTYARGCIFVLYEIYGLEYIFIYIQKEQVNCMNFKWYD